MKPRRIGTTRRIAWLQMSRGWLCVLALLAAIVLAGTGAIHGHAQSPAPSASASPKHAQSPAPPADASPKAGVHTKAQAAGQSEKLHEAGQPGKSKDASKAKGTILEQRRQKINGECADLLKMATSLKAQVDKTTKDELSVSVVRQADKIEKLATTVKNEMKPVVKKH